MDIPKYNRQAKKDWFARLDLATLRGKQSFLVYQMDDRGTDIRLLTSYTIDALFVSGVFFRGLTKKSLLKMKCRYGSSFRDLWGPLWDPAKCVFPSK